MAVPTAHQTGAVVCWCDDFYAGKRVLAGDLILLVEVAETSLPYDGGPKRLLCAEAGIGEYGLVNPVDGIVEVDGESGAKRELRAVPRELYPAIRDVIAALPVRPRPPGSEKMKARPGHRRLAHRREIYRD